MNTKKKPAKKRAYKKRVIIENTDSSEWVPLLNEVKPIKDTEIECLATICSIIDNWTPEQRKRNLEYICGKYYDFS